MLKRSLMALATGLVLAGCGARSISPMQVSGTTGVTLSGAARSVSGRTGVGNPFSVQLQGHGGPAVLYINYDDQQGYFTGWESSINAYVRVWTRSGRVIEVRSTSLVHPSGGTSVYGGYATLHGTAGIQDVAAGEVAFFRSDRWDSNLGRNYRIEF